MSDLKNPLAPETRTPGKFWKKSYGLLVGVAIGFLLFMAAMGWFAKDKGLLPVPNTVGDPPN